MNAVKAIRDRAGMTQAELAMAAGTSQPTIAAYESGTKSPTLRTLEGLARATGAQAVIDVVEPMTREDRRSLRLHIAIARSLCADPPRVLAKARRNLQTMRRANPTASQLLDEWSRVLKRSVGDIVDVMTDPRSHARELRQVTPFAGVLDPAERVGVYRRFRADESRS